MFFHNNDFFSDRYHDSLELNNDYQKSFSLDMLSSNPFENNSDHLIVLKMLEFKEDYDSNDIDNDISFYLLGEKSNLNLPINFIKDFIKENPIPKEIGYCIDCRCIYNFNCNKCKIFSIKNNLNENEITECNYMMTEYIHNIRIEKYFLGYKLKILQEYNKSFPKNFERKKTKCFIKNLKQESWNKLAWICNDMGIIKKSILENQKYSNKNLLINAIYINVKNTLINNT